MEDEPRIYSFNHKQCGHSEEHYKRVPNPPTLGEITDVPVIIVQSTDYCNRCMSTYSPEELLSARRFPPPPPRSDDIRRRTEGIWRRLAQNPGLVFPKDVAPFRDFIQHDVNFLLVLVQDIDEDLFRRWAKPEEDQPTLGQKSLFLQVRDAVQQGSINHLEGLSIPENEAFFGVWGLQLKERKTLLEPVQPGFLDRDEDGNFETTCYICAQDYFDNYTNWAPVMDAAMPIRTIPHCSCKQILCRKCALRVIEGDRVETITGPADMIMDIRPCYSCRGDLSASEALMAPINEEEFAKNPSPPWMDIFRPNE